MPRAGASFARPIALWLLICCAMIFAMVVIGGVTLWVTVFIHGADYRRGLIDPVGVLMHFVIAAVAYAFGLVLILRQFAGLYPEFFVSTGRSGLALRKTAYRNVARIEETGRRQKEAQLRIATNNGRIVPFTLPTRHLPSLYERVKPPL